MMGKLNKEFQVIVANIPYFLDLREIKYPKITDEKIYRKNLSSWNSHLSKLFIIHSSIASSYRGIYSRMWNDHKERGIINGNF